MSTSSNKQQKKGKDGMGKEGKRKEMVKDWCHTCHTCHAKVEVDVTKYHACHVKRRWMSPSDTPATPTAAASRRSTPAQARHRSQPSAIRATPATWNEGGCLQVPRLPRQQPWRPGVPLRPKRATGASPVPYVPRLPRKVRITKCPVPYVLRLPRKSGMSPSTTPATWNEGGCLQVPRLPRQQPWRPGVPLRPKRVTGASPVPYVPRLPRKSGSRCHQVPRLPRLPSFLPFVLPSFPPSLLTFFPPYFLASFLPSFLPSFCPVWSFIFFWCFSRPSVPVRSRWSCCRSHIYRRHAPQVWRELVGALEVLILQDCRFFDSPCLAFAAPPGCCPGCSYLSQGRSQGLSLSVQVEAFPFQLALEPRNAKSLTPDPGNFTSHRSQLTAWLMGLTKDSQWSRSVWLNATLIYATNENKHAKIIQTFHTTICFPHCIAGRLAPQRSARSIFHGAPKTVTQDVRLCTHVVLFFFAAVIARNLGHQNYKTNILRQNDLFRFELCLGFANSGGIKTLLNIFNFPELHTCVETMLGWMGLMLRTRHNENKWKTSLGPECWLTMGNPDLHLDILLTAGVWAQQGSCEMNTSLDPQSLCN